MKKRVLLVQVMVVLIGCHSLNNGFTNKSKAGIEETIQMFREHARKGGTEVMGKLLENKPDGIFCIKIAKEIMEDEATDEEVVKWLKEYMGEKLCEASQEGHEEVVKRLLEAGVDVNAADKNGWTALMLASQKGHVEVVKVLLEAGANKDAASNNGATTLMEAIYGGRMEVVKVLLEAGVNVNAADSCGWTALRNASRYGYEDMVRLLLKAGANVHAKDRSGKTPLDIAIRKGHTNVVTLLALGEVASLGNEGSWGKKEDLDVKLGIGYMEHRQRRLTLKELAGLGVKENISGEDVPEELKEYVTVKEKFRREKEKYEKYINTEVIT